MRVNPIKKINRDFQKVFPLKEEYQEVKSLTHHPFKNTTNKDKNNQTKNIKNRLREKKGRNGFN